jgi:hypothetical protein
MSVLPAGWDREPGPASAFDVAFAGVGLLTAAGVAVAGRRRRNAMLTTLGALPIAGTIAAVWSTTRVVGDVHPYLLLWTSVLLLPAWIGLGVLVADRLPAPWAPRALTAVLAGVAIASTAAVSTASWPPVRSSGDVSAGGALVRGWLDDHDVRRVRIEFSDHDEWPLAAGIINHLERRGTDVTVERNYLFLFGDQFEPTGREAAAVRLTPPGSPPPDPSLERLGDAGGATVWAGLVQR